MSVSDPRRSMSIDAPWAAPREVVEALAHDERVELVYVAVPFAASLEDAAAPHSSQREMVLGVLEQTLTEYLDSRGYRHGVVSWACDDLVAWVVRSSVEAGELQVPVLRQLRAVLDEANQTTTRSLDLARVEELGVIHVGLPDDAGAFPHRAYARTLAGAQKAASEPGLQERQRDHLVLARALDRRAFQFHFQPIVDVHGKQVIAYEALCRGTMPDFRFPDQIFATAERCDRVWELGRVLRDIAAESLDAMPAPGGVAPLLFVNVHPSDVDDPRFLEQTLSGPLSAQAERVVFELTERAAISDYRRIKELFGTLRRSGYRIAIDDLGSGYAGLTALAELDPEFIKFDMSLVRDIHLHPVKQRLLGRMIEFAHEIGAATISEGVETEEERDALLAAGAQNMQGYFFARPNPAFVEVAVERYGQLTKAI